MSGWNFWGLHRAFSEAVGSGPQTGPLALVELNGEMVNVETPREIVVKKILYKSESLKVRDIFDIACVFKYDRDQLLEVLDVYRSKLPLLEERLVIMRSAVPEELKSLAILDR